jgi:hypothetical protein
LNQSSDIDVEELTENFWNDIQSFLSEVGSQNSKKRKDYEGKQNDEQRQSKKRHLNDD